MSDSDKSQIGRMEDRAKETGTPRPGEQLSGAIPGDPQNAQRHASGGTAVADNAPDDEDEFMNELEAKRGEQKTGVPIEGVHVGTPAGGRTENNSPDHWGSARDEGQKVDNG